MVFEDDPDVQATIAANRFGWGGTPDGQNTAGDGLKAGLKDQIRIDGASQPSSALSTTPQVLAELENYRSLAARQRRETRAEDTKLAMTETGMASQTEAKTIFDEGRDLRRKLSEQTQSEFVARTRLAAESDKGFAERWSIFWANLFTISANSLETTVLVGQYEREAIRPHVFGTFEALAVAAETHPAMLSYLDQTRSVGPNSRAGLRRSAGLNENLAREMMELHTVGSQAGYTQTDVTELARALTGWGVNRDDDNPFFFRAFRHEPGPRTVLGKFYPQAGVGQGMVILRDLANHPATARRLSHRIASHFVADVPPPSLVEALEQRWLDTGGRLDAVAEALIDAPESWSLPPVKMKTPHEFVVSSHRALSLPIDRPRQLLSVLRAMGQDPYRPPSPEGWPDTAADWAGPDAMVKRLDWAREMGALAERRAPVAEEPAVLARAVLGPRLTQRTEQTVARAESRAEAITLFLMSPEFQRR